MGNPKIPGLRAFLLIILEMISKGESERCNEIETAITTGIATKFYRKYPSYFMQLDKSNTSDIDEYFKRWSGCAEGFESRKYLCADNAGLHLLIALALNEID